jgi:two-component system LytT family sensor kinase
MKLRIHTILPVVLAVAFPGIGFFVSENIAINNTPIAIKWSYTSIALLLLWQLLNTSWRFNPLIKQITFLFTTIPLFFLTISLIIFALGFKDNIGFESRELFRMVFLVLIFLTIQYASESQQKIKVLELEKEQLAKESYKAKLQSLRNQMDPHFLFNSLNTLYSMIRQNNVSSEDFVLNLGDFYRSTLNLNDRNTQTLSEELAFLESYLRLMKYRNEKAVIFNMDKVDSKYNLYQLPTLALQNVVENIFKHNALSAKKPIQITIKTTTEGFLEVRNNIQEKLMQPNNSGKGLQLLTERYRLLGIENGVIVSKTATNFEVKLKLVSSR